MAVIGVVTYLVWRFCIKTRRQPIVQEQWEEEQVESRAAEKDFAERRSTRASTRTGRNSIASTVLTRASNIIQIAYIPGVTNRATPTSPNVLVPPVPPIPMANSNASSPAATEDQHFFMPGDLRDSTYSALSGYTDRTSYGRASYAPRSSVASTIYGKNAVIAPAQTGMRAKPAMVSVRSANSNNSGGTTTPPVPTVDYEKYAPPVRPASPAGSAFSVGSTFLNNATQATATPGRAMIVRVGSGAKKPKSPMSRSATSPEDMSPVGSSVRDSRAVTLIDDSPTHGEGPFADPPDSASRRSIPSISNTSLSAVIEEATRRASGRNSSAPSFSGRERSPFSDEHATRQP